MPNGTKEVVLVGESEPIQRLRWNIGLVAEHKTTVRLLGETGSGKEVAAKLIHQGSRRQGPFSALNCAAVPEHLVESELFGHERGAFTGAIARRSGRFEQACGGTLFLDEIADMPLPTQAKLLRVLQEKTFERVGGCESIKTDVRIIVASHDNLQKLAEQRKFRTDLLYRLSVFPISVPALRERLQDIPLLVEYFLEDSFRQFRFAVDQDALAKLARHHWPGNVRELQNVIERAAILADGARIIFPEHIVIGEDPDTAPNVLHTQAADGLFARGPVDMTEYLEKAQREMIMEALKVAKGNKSRAADLLKLRRSTLTSQLRVLNIDETPAHSES